MSFLLSCGIREMPANVVGLWAVSVSQSSTQPCLRQKNVPVVNAKPFNQDHRPHESKAAFDSGDQLLSTRNRMSTIQ